MSNKNKQKAPERKPRQQGVQNNLMDLGSAVGSLIGTPYKWGGSILGMSVATARRMGVDCSGFTQWIAKNVFSVNSMPRTANEQMRRGPGAFIRNRGDLQKGDIVFLASPTGWKNSQRTYGPNEAFHVGVYLGDGRVAHSGGGGVKISNMNSPFWRKYFFGARRLNAQGADLGVTAVASVGVKNIRASREQAQAGNTPGAFVLGDLSARDIPPKGVDRETGLLVNHKYGSKAASPRTVLSQTKNFIRQNPHVDRNVQIVLSSGSDRNAQSMHVVLQQLRALRAAGFTNVSLMAVSNVKAYNTARENPDTAMLNMLNAFPEGYKFYDSKQNLSYDRLAQYRNHPSYYTGTVQEAVQINSHQLSQNLASAQNGGGYQPSRSGNPYEDVARRAAAL